MKRLLLAVFCALSLHSSAQTFVKEVSGNAGQFGTSDGYVVNDMVRISNDTSFIVVTGLGDPAFGGPSSLYYALVDDNYVPYWEMTAYGSDGVDATYRNGFIYITDQHGQLRKLDLSGNTLWHKEVTSTTGWVNFLTDPQVTNDNHIISLLEGDATGYTLVKVDDAGNLIWTQNYGCHYMFGQSLVETSDGNYLMTSLSYDTVSGCVSTEQSIHFAKVDTSGAVLWTRAVATDTAAVIGEQWTRTIELADSSFLCLANKRYQSEFLAAIRLDKNGNYISSHTIELDYAGEIVPHNINQFTSKGANEHIMAGYVLIDNRFYNTALSISDSGTVNAMHTWKNDTLDIVWFTDVGLTHTHDSLLIVSSMFRSGWSNHFFLNVFKTDLQGSYGCNEINIAQSIHPYAAHDTSIAITPTQPAYQWNNYSFPMGFFNSTIAQTACSSFIIDSIMMFDLGVDSAYVTFSAACASTDSVYAHIHNFGFNTVYTYDVEWYINGQSQGIINITDSIMPGETDTLFLGVPALTLGTTLAVTVMNPNNFTDVVAANDNFGFTHLVPNSVNILTSDSGFCPGDSLLLVSSLDDVNYQLLWSTGSTNSSIYVSTAGAYVLTATDSAGCVSSDVFSASVHPTPTPSINLIDSILTCSSASTFQWYLNGQPINGANSQTYTAQASGIYHVAVTNLYGCEGASSTVDYDHSIWDGIRELEALGIYLQSNIVTNQLKLSANDDVNRQYYIFDVYGNVVREGFFSRQLNLDLSDIAVGLYFLNIPESTVKFVKLTH